MEFILGLIWLVSIIIGVSVGSSKGEGCISLMMTILLGPFWLPIIFISKGNRKQCPYCREYIDKKAIVCSHCQRDLSKPEIINNVQRDDVPRLKFNADKTGYYCPKCSTMNPIDMTTCRKCGEEIQIV